MENQLFEPELETMPREQIAELQEDRILRLVSSAYENSPMYRWWWGKHGVHPDDIKSLADFNERIPFISKGLIKTWRDEHGDPFGGLLIAPWTRVNAVMSSSGTTGEPTFFAERHEPWSPLSVGLVRSLWEHGLRPGDRALAQPTTFRGVSNHSLRMIGVTSVEINSFLGAWPEVLKAIDTYNIRYVQLMGPLMSELESLSEHCDMRAALEPLKFASFAGEPLGSRLQTKVRDEWDTKLVMWTSAGDVGTAWQCSELDGYHIWEDTALVECRDPAGDEAVSDGEVGELVVTALDDDMVPLIRYRSDDLVRIDRSRCGCGRTHVREWPMGRKGDRTIVQGKTVMPQELWEIIERCDETRAALFQVIRPDEQVDELRIRIGYDSKRTTTVDGLRDRLMGCIEEGVGIRPILEMIDEQAIIAQASSAAKIPRVAKH